MTPSRYASTSESAPIRFEPRGGVRAAWLSKDPELVVSGPAGTGKTRGLLDLIHLRAAYRYPGSRTLITRKTRTSLTQTAMVTFNAEVRPQADGAVWRTTEQEYRYPNGSVVVVGGLDKEGKKVFSGQYDYIYINEATELEEVEWENLTTRLRNGVSPTPQILADCNPDRPTHWLKRRCDVGKTRMIESRHEDNPRLHDGKDWTDEGRRYVFGVLERLTGARLLRLRYGRWVQAEGVVYDQWSPSLHLVDRFDIPADWPRIWSVDFGYTNPFCWQAWAIDGDGRLFRYREIYHTRRLVRDHAQRILEITADDPWPVAIICDSADAEGRATLEDALGMPTMPATKGAGSIRAGIQMVQARLRCAGDGRPRLYLLRGSLDHRDPALDDAKQPTCTEEEFDAYVWDQRQNRDQPIDASNHGLDALRYLVAGLDTPGQPGDDTIDVLV